MTDQRGEETQQDLRRPGGAVTAITGVIAQEAIAGAAHFQQHRRDEDETEEEVLGKHPADGKDRQPFNCQQDQQDHRVHAGQPGIAGHSRISMR